MSVESTNNYYHHNNCIWSLYINNISHYYVFTYDELADEDYWAILPEGEVYLSRSHSINIAMGAFDDKSSLFFFNYTTLSMQDIFVNKNVSAEGFMQLHNYSLHIMPQFPLPHFFIDIDTEPPPHNSDCVVIPLRYYISLKSFRQTILEIYSIDNNKAHLIWRGIGHSSVDNIIYKTSVFMRAYSYYEYSSIAFDEIWKINNNTSSSDYIKGVWYEIPITDEENTILIEGINYSPATDE